MRWEEMTSPEIHGRDRDKTVLLLPLGSVEQHGHHMPVGTDSMIAEALCLSVAESRDDVLVLPAPWYGFSAHHMRFAGSITLTAETMMSMVSDIIGSVVQHGFRRILLVNGHGGNGGVVDLLASTLGHRHYGAARVAGVTYFQLAKKEIDSLRSSGPGGTGHAGEFETSMMLHLREALVHMDRAQTTYPEPGSSYLTTDLTGASAIKVYHDFGDLSASGTLGDPGHADIQKGRRFFEACVTSVGAFVDDFATWRIPGRTE